MLKFSSKKILLFFAAILFFVVFFRFFNLLSFPDPETAMKKGDVFKLAPENSLTQTFTANRDNLVRIEFLLRTPRLKKETPVEMKLADETCIDTIREGFLEWSFLDSNNLYDFQFEKIPDSNGKKYCLIATFKPQESKAKKIGFFTREEKNPEFALTDKKSDMKIENQALSTRLVYKNDSVWQDISELNQRISQYKPWFLKHYYLYAISILFVIISTALVVILIVL